MTDNEIPEDAWISLAYVLGQPGDADRPKVTVALLKKVIEAKGVRTHDQWGELVMATAGDEQERTSKARAYKLLADYYAELKALEESPPGVHPARNPDDWLSDPESPLNQFGWPEEEVPNFAEWIDKSRQKETRREDSNSSYTEASAKQNESVSPVQDKPWCVANPKDPEPALDWYTSARYFARELVKKDPTLLLKRDILASRIVQLLTNVGIKKRGGEKPFNPDTIKKALSNVSLG